MPSRDDGDHHFSSRTASTRRAAAEAHPQQTAREIILPRNHHVPSRRSLVRFFSLCLVRTTPLNCPRFALHLAHCNLGRQSYSRPQLLHLSALHTLAHDRKSLFADETSALSRGSEENAAGRRCSRRLAEARSRALATPSVLPIAR